MVFIEVHFLSQTNSWWFSSLFSKTGTRGFDSASLALLQFFTDCREWVTEMIDLFPSVCILDSNGDPATWILQQEYGAIGMLQVVPKYRRAKLGSAAIMLLAQRVCEENYNVYSLVRTDNTASLAFHERNRFEYVKDFTVGVVNYQSKGDWLIYWVNRVSHRIDNVSE